MTHDGIIHCGGVGEVLGEKTIAIKDHAGLNLAIHLKHRNETPHAFEQKQKKIAKLVKDIYKVASEPGDELHNYPKD